MANAMPLKRLRRLLKPMVLTGLPRLLTQSRNDTVVSDKRFQLSVGSQ